MTHAWDVTVRQSVDMLDSNFDEFARGVTARQYVLWLGSGISRDRMPGLDGIVEQLLEGLRIRIDLSDPNCPYEIALVTVLKLAGVDSLVSGGIDKTKSVTFWPNVSDLITQLVQKYSQVLEVSVGDKGADYIMWDILDLASTYSSAVVEPDCEHICIAILIKEQAFDKVVSANWDDLIEKALEKISDVNEPGIKVCVAAEDFLGPELDATLFKFHGCARKAKQDEGRYREYLVGRKSQIFSWIRDLKFEVMRENLKVTACGSPTLMLGLSAQDANIIDLFVHATTAMGWPWPSVPPPFVIGEEELGEHQETLLRSVYRDHFSSNSVAIEQASHFRGFGKQMLTGLVLKVIGIRLLEFLKVILDTARPSSEFVELQEGLVHLRNKVADQGGAEYLDFIWSFVDHWTEAMRLFRKGVVTSADKKYLPTSMLKLNQIAAGENALTSGLAEFVLLISILGHLEKASECDVEVGRTSVGAICITVESLTTGRKMEYVPAMSFAAANNMIKDGIVPIDDSKIIMAFSSDIPIGFKRSPHSALGRTGNVRTKKIQINKIYQASSSFDDFKAKFKSEVLL